MSVRHGGGVRIHVPNGWCPVMSRGYDGERRFWKRT